VPAKEATALLPASSPAAKAMEQPAQQAAMPPATVATVVAAAIAAAVATVVAAAITTAVAAAITTAVAAAVIAGVATTVAAGVATAVARRLNDRRIATAVATASAVVRRDVGHVARLVVTAQSAEGHQHHDRTLHFIPPRCETL